MPSPDPNPPSPSSPPSSSAFNYPWAAAPDIIRANQKDAYFQSRLLTHLSSLIRTLYGTRTEHKYTNEATVLTELLYLSLTTLIGNRTLGEEYTDVVQICADTHTLPSLTQRAGYILSCILAPYTLSKLLPALRRKVRAKLERRVARTSKSATSRVAQFQAYALKHLDTLTSPAPLYALSLAVFYFSGAYYQLSKRVFRLRYVFTRALSESDARAGYEVLGVLLVLQMAVQGYLHVRETVGGDGGGGERGRVGGEEGDEMAVLTAEPPLLFEAHAAGSVDPEVVTRRILRTTHTPGSVFKGGEEGETEEEEEEGEEEGGKVYRYAMQDGEAMRWMGETAQQRKCTLCLEPLRDPSATTCGHVFCWSCVTDWLREQPMCPLCRQPALVQHVLPLRG